MAGELDSPRDEDTDLLQGSWISPETRTLTCVAGELDSLGDEDTDLWQGSWIPSEMRTLTCGRGAGFPRR